MWGQMEPMWFSINNKVSKDNDEDMYKSWLVLCAVYQAHRSRRP